MPTETETAASNWTTETLKQHLSASINAVESRLEDRDKFYHDLFQSIDRRYQERFDAQQRALSTALAAEQPRIIGLIAASDKAIAKAEQAQDRHNAGQVEWRQQIGDAQRALADRARTDTENMVHGLSSRTDVALRATMDRIEQLQKATGDRIESLQTRLDRAEGRASGFNSNLSTSLSMLAVLAALIGAGLAIFNSSRISTNTGAIERQQRPSHIVPQRIYPEEQSFIRPIWRYRHGQRT